MTKLYDNVVNLNLSSDDKRIEHVDSSTVVERPVGAERAVFMREYNAAIVRQTLEERKKQVVNVCIHCRQQNIAGTQCCAKWNGIMEEIKK